MASWMKRLNKWSDPLKISPHRHLSEDMERQAKNQYRLFTASDQMAATGSGNAGPIAGPASGSMIPGPQMRPPMAGLNIQPGVNPFAARAAQAGFTDFKGAQPSMTQMATALRGPSVSNPNMGGSYGR